MNVPTRLAAFLLAVAAMFAGTYAVGAGAGPITAAEPASHEMADDAATGHGEPAAHADEAAPSGPGGLAVSADGYTLRPLPGVLVAGQPGEFAFQIVEESGRPVTDFEVSHDKRLHLIVARRDLTGFQHLHPVMSPDGTWRTRLRLAQAGQWRMFADFLPHGHDPQVILGLDVPVAGDYRPQPLPAAAATAPVEDYTVTANGDLVAGHTSRLTLTVSRAGAPVTDLQPYLGAYGHLVALRAGDLGYLHVHPQESTVAGPQVVFDVEVPTAGAYRLFLDFQHDGVVRTAAFTAAAG